MRDTQSVCILMGTYNGQAYLAEQLLSIEKQSHNNWRLIISDDGSTDATLDIAKEFQEKWGADRLEIRQGPQQGFSKNFLSLACDFSISADFYAFCDQDDVWMVDKLRIALEYLNVEKSENLARVYCGRTKLVDENLNSLGYSPLFTLPLSFRNALVQNVASGNTIVFNQATKYLLETAGIVNVAFHDWWVYQFIKGVDGVVFYDPEPTILYRQHDGSIVGSKDPLKDKIVRLRYVLKDRFKAWNTMNYEALLSVNHILNNENQDILAFFGKCRNGAFKDRMRLFDVCGLYRQTWPGTLSLWFLNLINKI